MLDTGEQIVGRFDELKANRGSFEDTWQQIANNILGLRDFTTSRNPGEQRMRRIYDTTGLIAGTRLAAALHGMMLNPSNKWFFLKIEPEELSENDDVFVWLENATKALRYVFTEGRFGFANAAAEWLLDQVYFGTGDLFVDDVPGSGPQFYSRPLGEVYIDESWMGKPDTFFRHYKMSARRVVQQFGDVDEHITRLAEKEPNRDVKLVHLIHPRSESKANEKDNKPWRSVYVLYEKKKIVSLGGYYTQPHMVARWSKENHELYGRSPAWQALSDCKMLNEMSKTLLKTAQKAADPPLLVPDDGVLSMVSTSPGSLNVYRAHTFKEDPIRPFPVAGNSIISEKMLEQRQSMVRAAFFADAIALPNQSGMTATQVIELEDKMARSMVSMLGRLQHEGIDPLLVRTLDVLERGRFILPRPPTMKGARVRIEYISPAARAQKQSEARAIMGAWASVATLGEVAIEAIDNLDPDETVRLLAESQGVPPGILRSVQDRETIREERAQAQQQMQQLQQAQQVAGVAQQLGGAEKALAEAASLGTDGQG